MLETLSSFTTFGTSGINEIRKISGAIGPDLITNALRMVNSTSQRQEYYKY